MTRYLLPALLLIACGGDSDPAGPDAPAVLRAEAGWTFFVDCPGRLTLFTVESVSGSRLTGTQLDQFPPSGIIIETPAVSRVEYSANAVTYSEDESIEQFARTGTMQRDGDGYSADATVYCSHPPNTVWPNGPPIMRLGP